MTRRLRNRISIVLATVTVSAATVAVAAPAFAAVTWH
jgi:hypothetical protein